MKSDKYYKVDLAICPWLKDTLIGELLALKPVHTLETATYKDGAVRFHIALNPKRKEDGVRVTIADTVLRRFEGPLTITYEGDES